MRFSTQRWHAYFLFPLGVTAVGLLIGFLDLPGDWYARLAKPFFTPPDWLFAPVWTVLYLAIGLAGGRLWRRERYSRAMGLWWFQLALNYLWSPLFFRFHRMELALADIIALLATLLAFIATARREDRTAALLFLPYAAWVAYATALNAALLSLN